MFPLYVYHPIKRTPLKSICVISFVIVLILQARNLTATADLERIMESLLSAPTAEERNEVMQENRTALNVELRKALIAKSNDLKRKGDYQEAALYSGVALEVSKEISDHAGMGAALFSIGEVQFRLGKYDQAIESYKQSMKIVAEQKDRKSLANATRWLAITYMYMGEYELAETQFTNALTEYRQMAVQDGLAEMLNVFGMLYMNTGVPDDALKLFWESQKIAEELNDRGTLSAVLCNIGNSHFDRGNYALALQYYQQSLAVCEELQFKVGIANQLFNIANVHQRQGNLDVALEVHQKSLQFREEMKEASAVAQSLRNIGEIYRTRGQYSLALESFEKAMTVSKNVSGKHGVANEQMQIGDTLMKQRKFSEAKKHYEEALSVFREVGKKSSIGTALKSLSMYHFSTGDHAQSLELADQSASIARELENPELLWQSRYAAGNAYLAMGSFDKAQTALQESAATIEKLRTMVAGGEREKQLFFESRILPYSKLVDLFVQKNDAMSALFWAERAKARVLLDVIQKGKINISHAMTDKEQAKEQSLRNRMSFLNAAAMKEETGAQHPTKLKRIGLELAKTRREFEAFQTDLYARYPDLKILRAEGKLLNQPSLNRLIQSDTAYLEFAWTDERLFLFVISRRTPKSKIEISVLKIEQPEKVMKQVASFREVLASRALNFREPAATLYSLLLGPAESILNTKKSIVIVPDGPLWELPFQSLLRSNRYLIEDFAISYVPSMTVLVQMRNLSPSSARFPADGTLLAFANPDLNVAVIQRSRQVLRDATLQPLPETEKEVSQLQELYGRGSKVYVGANASEDRLKSEAMNFAVLHLASHGYLNNVSPMYSHVILSPSAGVQNEDGFLEAWELMELKLKNKLAVLSACETGRGRAGAGEGLIGLSWALFVAGAPTAVVSQWKVESVSTSRLMIEFHKNMRSESDSPSQALRDAGLTLLRSSQYSHPFYWAGFVVMGESS